MVARFAPLPFGHSGYWGFRPEASDSLIIAAPYHDRSIYNIDGGLSIKHGGWFTSKNPNYYRQWLASILEVKEIMKEDGAMKEDESTG
jgi:hypothetical protein